MAENAQDRQLPATQRKDASFTGSSGTQKDTVCFPSTK